MPGRHTYASVAQMRWANATHQEFAPRWNEATELAGKSKTLPARKRPPKSAYRTARSMMSRG
jgi:hypothetical protein